MYCYKNYQSQQLINQFDYDDRYPYIDHGFNELYTGVETPSYSTSPEDFSLSPMEYSNTNYKATESYMDIETPFCSTSSENSYYEDEPMSEEEISVPCDSVDRNPNTFSIEISQKIVISYGNSCPTLQFNLVIPGCY